MSERELTARTLGERLLQVLTSRRVLTAFATVIVGWLTLNIPELQPLHSELLVLLVSVALVLITGMSSHEAARIGREQASIADTELRERVKVLLAELVDELMEKDERSRDGS